MDAIGDARVEQKSSKSGKNDREKDDIGMEVESEFPLKILCIGVILIGQKKVCLVRCHGAS